MEQQRRDKGNIGWKEKQEQAEKQVEEFNRKGQEKD